MTPSTQIHCATTIISEGACLLENTIDQGGFIHPDAFASTDLERTIKRLEDLASKLRITRERLLENVPADMRPVVHLQAAE